MRARVALLDIVPVADAPAATDVKKSIPAALLPFAATWSMTNFALAVLLFAGR